MRNIEVAAPCDFSLKNGSNFKDSLDFVLQHWRARELKRVFGIDHRLPLPVDRRARKDFLACRDFLRERIWWLGTEEACRLMDFVSVYIVSREKRQNFVPLSRQVLKEICGCGKNFNQVSSSDKVMCLFSGSEGTEEAREMAVKGVFYFWTAVFRQLFPVKPLLISDIFNESLTFSIAKGQADLALKRSMRAMIMAKEIFRIGDDLGKMSVFPFQQEFWIRSLLDHPKKGRHLAVSQPAARKFRHYAVVNPGVSLGRDLFWLRLSEASQRGVMSLPKALEDFIRFLTDREGVTGVKSWDQHRVNCLRWLRQRTPVERRRILKILTEKKIGVGLEDLFKSEEFKSSVRFGRKGKYPRRKVLNRAISPVISVLYEFLEGRPMEEIMVNAQPPCRMIEEFVRRGVEAASANNIRPVLKDLLISTQRDITKNNRCLSDREILTTVFAIASIPFDGPTFIDTFREIFFEKLSALDDPE